MEEVTWNIASRTLSSSSCSTTFWMMLLFRILLIIINIGFIIDQRWSCCWCLIVVCHVRSLYNIAVYVGCLRWSRSSITTGDHCFSTWLCAGICTSPSPCCCWGQYRLTIIIIAAAILLHPPELVWVVPPVLFIFLARKLIFKL